MASQEDQEDTVVSEEQDQAPQKGAGRGRKRGRKPASGGGRPRKQTAKQKAEQAQEELQQQEEQFQDAPDEETPQDIVQQEVTQQDITQQEAIPQVLAEGLDKGVKLEPIGAGAKAENGDMVGDKERAEVQQAEVFQDLEQELDGQIQATRQEIESLNVVQDTNMKDAEIIEATALEKQQESQPIVDSDKKVEVTNGDLKGGEKDVKVQLKQDDSQTKLDVKETDGQQENTKEAVAEAEKKEEVDKIQKKENGQEIKDKDAKQEAAQPLDPKTESKQDPAKPKEVQKDAKPRDDKKRDEDRKKEDAKKHESRTRDRHRDRDRDGKEKEKDREGKVKDKDGNDKDKDGKDKDKDGKDKDREVRDKDREGRPKESSRDNRREHRSDRDRTRTKDSDKDRPRKEHGSRDLDKRSDRGRGARRDEKDKGAIKEEQKEGVATAQVGDNQNGGIKGDNQGLQSNEAKVGQGVKVDEGQMNGAENKDKTGAQEVQGEKEGVQKEGQQQEGEKKEGERGRERRRESSRNRDGTRRDGRSRERYRSVRDSERNRSDSRRKRFRSRSASQKSNESYRRPYRRRESRKSYDRDYRNVGYGYDKMEATETVYISGIPSHVDEAELNAVFERYFKGVKSVRLQRDRITNASRGFAFMDMETVDHARLVVEGPHVDKIKVGGEFTQPLTLEYSQSQPHNRQSQSENKQDWICGMCQAVNFARRLDCYQCNTRRAADAKRVNAEADGPSKILKVVGLDAQISEQHLSALFSGDAHLTDVRIVREKFSQQPRGFGFVEFNSIADASKILNKFQNFNLQNQSIKLSFARDRVHGDSGRQEGNEAIEAAQAQQQYNKHQNSKWQPKQIDERRFVQTNAQPFYQSVPPPQMQPPPYMAPNFQGRPQMMVQPQQQPVHQPQPQPQYFSFKNNKDMMQQNPQAGPPPQPARNVMTQQQQQQAAAMQHQQAIQQQQQMQLQQQQYQQQMQQQQQQEQQQQEQQAKRQQEAARAQQQQQQQQQGAEDPSQNFSAQILEQLVANGYSYDQESGYYYHPESGYYYDPKSQLYYHGATNQWYRYDQAKQEYVVFTGQEEQKDQAQSQDNQYQQGQGQPVQQSLPYDQQQYGQQGMEYPYGQDVHQKQMILQGEQQELQQNIGDIYQQHPDVRQKGAIIGAGPQLNVQAKLLIEKERQLREKEIEIEKLRKTHQENEQKSLQQQQKVQQQQQLRQQQQDMHAQQQAQQQRQSQYGLYLRPGQQPQQQQVIPPQQQMGPPSGPIAGNRPPFNAQSKSPSNFIPFNYGPGPPLEPEPEGFKPPARSHNVYNQGGPQPGQSQMGPPQVPYGQGGPAPNAMQPGRPVNQQQIRPGMGPPQMGNFNQGQGQLGMNQQQAKQLNMTKAEGPYQGVIYRSKFRKNQ